MARLAIRSDSIRTPQRGTRGALPYPDFLREKHTALTNEDTQKVEEKALPVENAEEKMQE